MKLLTVEFEREIKTAEIHLNRNGAEYLRNLLTQLIEEDTNDHLHLMTED